MPDSVDRFQHGISQADYQDAWAQRVAAQRASEQPIAAAPRPTPDPSPEFRCRCVPKTRPTDAQVFFLRCTALAGPDGLCESCRDPFAPCSVDGRVLVGASAPCFIA